MFKLPLFRICQTVGSQPIRTTALSTRLASDWVPQDKETHTGQIWDSSDYRQSRFVDRPKHVNPNFSIKLIDEVPPKPSKERIVWCDGGSGPEGHPKVYINLVICESCGLTDCSHINSFQIQFEDAEDESLGTVEMEHQLDDGLNQSQSNVHSDMMTFEELLIANNVEARPALWNLKLSIGQRGKSEKDWLWQEIAKFFANQHPITHLQKKWRNLRDHYVKVKGELESYVLSGSGAGSKQRKIWKHYESMKFLSDIMNPRITTTNLGNGAKASSTDESTPKAPTPELQTDKPGNHICGYCGLRFYKDGQHH